VVRQDADGGYIIAGRTESYRAGVYDVYLQDRCDGDTLWTKDIGGAKTTLAEFC